MSRSSANIASILSDYERQLQIYQEFTSDLEKLVVQLLRTNRIRPHSVTSRIKDQNSLDRKLKKPDGSYTSLREITDLAGIRVITYFADEAAEVARVIEENFDVDKARSGDKRLLLDPDRFGYLSLHYVVKLGPDRQNLPEWRRFSALTAEIQIRSILQHAWAEIEHDLGYKTRYAVPLSVRRCFARLAGLFELADDEFMRLRDSLAGYSKKLPELIRTSPEDVSVDQESISVFIKTSDTVKRIDERLSKSVQARLINPTKTRCGLLSHLLNAVDFRTIAQVEAALVAAADGIVSFKQKHFQIIEGHEALFHGACLFVLCWIKFVSRGNRDYIANHLPDLMYPTMEEKTQEAERFLSIAKTLGIAEP